MEEGGRLGRNLQQQQQANSSPGHYYETGEAAASYPHHEQQQQQQQYQQAVSSDRGGGQVVDPVQDWMRSRQAAFRDFERSFNPFQQLQPPQPPAPPQSSVFEQNQLFYPPVSLSPYVNNNSSRWIQSGDNNNGIFDQGRGGKNNSRRRGNDYDNFDQQDYSTMLSSRGTQELSPKAKVSYDEGKIETQVKSSPPPKITSF